MKITIPFVLLLFVFWGCSKTKSEVSPETKTDLLTKNSWIMNKYVISTISKSIDVYSKGGTSNLAKF